ncbi:uncharacterized protein METZ01_LOCUS471655 [marine metagenome]|uniref:VOC domain-containing protein n=1 Tax=marine metagenome TaxID=408172 RepID=A0A383BG50_9ZZZZ
MTAFKIIATNHTSFTVSDLDRSLAFFRDALGFEVSSKGPRSASLIQAITGVEGAEVLIAYVRGPAHSIELIQYIKPETRSSVRPQPCDTGFSHIAYDVDDIDAAIKAARDHSVEPIGPVVAIDQGPNRGRRVAYLRDPDGITIEFIEKA